MQKIQNYLAVATLTSLSLALTACFGEKAETTAEITTEEKVTDLNQEKAQVADSEKETSNLPMYKVGVVLDFEPYAFRGENNQITGFSIDLANAIAEQQGFNVEYLDKQWDSNFDSIQTGKIDFMANPVTILPERDEIIDFSKPYITSNFDAAVTDELKDNTFEQLIATKSLKYSAMGKTVLYDYAMNTLGIEESRLVPSATSFTSVSDIFNGNANVAISDGNILKYLKKQYPEMHIITNDDHVSQYAYAVKNGDSEKKQMLDEGIDKLKANGKYDEIYAKWFGD